ncbi:M56 family metallopeptidase [Caulobacter sp. DWR1-3-2b1]|uniref:M56 family metallopeptidase n=1 Tax=Caulobacter sp. DWR1-3-2b1 TaxID=2804670 RepID=UPI003CF6FFD9
MAAEVLTHLAFCNLAAGLAILLALILRHPTRALFGAEIAYLLWLLPVAAGLAALLPARAAEPGVVAARHFIMSGDHAAILGGLWLVGVSLALALLVWSQSRFMQRARLGRAGPAVVGVLVPRMIVPDDYQTRFTIAERAVIRAHERAHIERLDPRINALMALIQCLGWFNPLIHLAVREARLDQELACDARVMGRLSRERGLYARTLLKTQLGARALPLGCHWPAAALHPLEERVIMLTRPQPTLHRTATGGALVMAMSLTAAVGAWSAQPVGPPRPVAAPVVWPEVVVYARMSLALEP